MISRCVLTTHQFDGSLDAADAVTAWLEGYDAAGHVVVKLTKREEKTQPLPKISIPKLKIALNFNNLTEVIMCVYLAQQVFSSIRYTVCSLGREK